MYTADLWDSSWMVRGKEDMQILYYSHKKRKWDVLNIKNGSQIDGADIKLTFKAQIEQMIAGDCIDVEYVSSS